MGVGVKEFNTVDGQLFIGETKEIEAMFNSIVKNRNTDIRPLYAEKPIFSENKQFYGLLVDHDNWMTVVNSDTVLAILLASGIL